ncbi:hypothetical protein CDD81_4556 [Ophiocordyceps australis]|uniref:Protein sip5 n=1 Tax=Ophiocordyceps australis TaxID=1399860 RepID=A0A2C5YC74_9HYPO|nr:hypothetical protein CDD81_4556 [Ophiocordyceps australis]
MGNSNAKESRSAGNAETAAEARGRRAEDIEPVRHRNRISRGDLGNLFTLQSSSRSRDRDRQTAPFERRETRQERDARRLERDRVARAKERDRSMREEHVDGGYLVTLGTYTGIEDFSKPVVRQLQIERKLAPFWRGLNDWSGAWIEHQLIAAARGLPVPPANAPPDAELVSKSSSIEGPSQAVNSLTVPMGSRTLSTASDRSQSGAGSSLQSPASTSLSKTALKPRAKALVGVLSSNSFNASLSEATSKEAMLPHDPFVNGQAIEVFLYKNAEECPICFLSYPPYINSTRCCDQPICSECFVQIKRAEPHLPEHHPDGQARNPNDTLNPEDPPEMLISEPSSCPYCQQPEFGVTYEPPPFRRGLVYSTSSAALSSQSSLSSTISPPSPQTSGRKRGHSLSATAPNVITTDRVRPDWANKLAAVRAHQARRAAAATALHTAAFLVGNDQRSIMRSSRFGRRNTGGEEANSPGIDRGGSAGVAGTSYGLQTTNASSEGNRRSRMEELEEMMFMEAVRLSLASEEERKRKEEKTLRKEVKKRQQEERKAHKKQNKSPYSGGSSGTSGSSVSLGLGRKRDNSATSNVNIESAPQTKPGESSRAADQEHDDQVPGKGKGVDRSNSDAVAALNIHSASLAIPGESSQRGSHLRQISNTSSLGSSLADSPSGSYRDMGSSGPEGGGGRLRLGVCNDDGDCDTGSEPLFNFRSLAELVGVNLDEGGSTSAAAQVGTEELVAGNKDMASRPLSQVKEDEKEDAQTEHIEQRLTGTKMDECVSPAVRITPDTPTDDAHSEPRTAMPLEMGSSPAEAPGTTTECKGLGQPRVLEQPPSITQ